MAMDGATPATSGSSGNILDDVAKGITSFVGGLFGGGGGETDAQRQAREDARRQRVLDEARIAAQGNAADRQRTELARQNALGLRAPQAQAAQVGQAERIGNDAGQVAGSSFRGGQQDLISMLQAQARGQGPSLAQAQLQSATDRNLAQLMAAQAAARGPGGGMALRGLRDAQASATQQAANQSAQLRLQEQLQAQGLLGNVLQGARGQDVSVAQTQAQLDLQRALANQAAGNQFALTQAGFNQQTGLANLNAQQSTQALAQQLAQRYLEMGLSQDEADRRAQMDAIAMAEGVYEQQQNRENQMSLLQEQESLHAKDFLPVLGGALGAVGAAIASDVRAKEDIRDASRDYTRRFIDQTRVGPDPGPAAHQDPSQYADASRSIASGLTRMISAIAGKRTGDATSSEDTSAEDAFLQRFTSAPVIDAAGWSQDAYDASAPLPSDRRAKSGADEKGSDVDGFLDALSAYTYRYRDPARHGDGRHLGIMAQDLERTELGRSMVHDTPEGKVIDGGKLAGAAMAAAVELHQRQKALEAQLKKKGGK